MPNNVVPIIYKYCRFSNERFQGIILLRIMDQGTFYAYLRGWAYYEREGLGSESLKKFHPR